MQKNQTVAQSKGNYVKHMMPVNVTKLKYSIVSQPQFFFHSWREYQRCYLFSPDKGHRLTLVAPTKSSFYSVLFTKAILCGE